MKKMRSAEKTVRDIRRATRRQYSAEEKKLKLEKAFIKESKADETSDRCHDLMTELKVVSKLVKQARKHDKVVRE